MSSIVTPTLALRSSTPKPYTSALKGDPPKTTIAAASTLRLPLWQSGTSVAIIVIPSTSTQPPACASARGRGGGGGAEAPRRGSRGLTCETERGLGSGCEQGGGVGARDGDRYRTVSITTAALLSPILSSTPSAIAGAAGATTIWGVPDFSGTTG